MDVPLKEYVEGLIAQLKEYFESLITQQFDSQKEAVGAALAAQKELTASAFAASEKAITKAEEAQKSYNQTHNDLSRKMDEQYKAMMPRPEADNRFGTLDKAQHELKDELSRLRLEVKEENNKLRTDLMREIGSLRESRSEGAGEKGGKLSQRELIGWAAGLIATLVAVFFALKG